MYKLENDVEWTQELKEAFKHNITRAKIIYNNGNTDITIDENTGIKDLTLEDNRYVPDLGFIGQATARKLKLTLLDNAQTTNLENKEFSLYIGADYNNSTYYINYGKFIVNEPPENDSTNGTIQIVAYDYMIKFNKNYEDQVVYPCTLKAYLLNICSQAGVELGSQSFANDDFLVSDNQFEGKQLREILQHIGKCAFSWVRIGQDNKLYLDFKATETHPTIEEITIDEYKQDAYKKANEYYGPINKVTYGDSDIQGQEESISDSASIVEYGEKELVINDNYFAYTTSKREVLIQDGSVLFGLKYMPISQLDLIGFVYLDCNDYIKIYDEQENYIITRAFSHTIKYNGIVSDSIETEGISLNEQTYKNKNSTVANNTRTEIIVDRANKKITQITEEVSQYDSRIATVEQTVDGIKQQVENAVDYKRTVEGITQVHLTEAMEQNAIEVEIRGNRTYLSELYPSEELYPSTDLYINMEGEELR